MSSDGIAELKLKLQPNKDQTPMSTGTITVLKAQAQLPAELAAAIDKEGLKEFSYAAANGEVVELQNFGEKDDFIATLKNLRETDTYLNDTLVLHCVASDKDVHAEDHQPFEVIKDKTGALLVAFAEGDFPDFEDPDGVHSNEYFLVQEKISEIVKAAYQACGQDLTKTMEKLGSAEYKKSMVDLLAPRGVITLIAGDGSDPVTYAINEQGYHGDFGYVSRMHGWTPAEAAAPKVLSRQEILAQKRAEAAAGTGHNQGPPLDKPAGAPGPSVPVIPAAPATSTKIPDRATEVMVTPPPNMHGKHLRGWHTKHFGSTAPINLQAPRPVSGLLPTSNLRHLNTLGDLGKTQTAPATPSQGMTQYAAIVPPQAKKTLMERIKDNKLSMLEPEKMPEAEKEYPPFSEQIGEPVEKLVLWTNQELRNLGHQELFCYANEMRHRLVNALPALVSKKAAAAAAEPEVKLSRQEILAQRRKAG